MDELDVIDRFFARGGARRGDVPLGIGDDAAVVDAGGQRLLVTSDVLAAGVHFPEAAPAAAVGHKALAVNLSDIAAMGGTPAWASLGLTLPDADAAWLAGFRDGFFALAGEYDVALIGGDTTRGPLSIAVHLIGAVAEEGYLPRSGARDDDVVYVSGSLGDAALGLQVFDDALRVPTADAAYFLERLHRPQPRVELGRALVRHASAAIDLSDGLAADLHHLCQRSGVGAAVDVAALPLSAAYRRHLDEAGWTPALSFGDDYELCFTVPPERAGAVERLGHELGVPVTAVGRIGGASLTWTHDGEPFAFHEQGYRHFA